MNELSPQLELIGAQLRSAYGRRLRKRRLMRTTGAATLLATISTVAALGASGDLQLDPTKWAFVSGGSVDNGRGEYVHAKSLKDGGPSTFMVEHDAGMGRYDAFLLHERVTAAANETSPVQVRTESGALCSREELTRIEQKAIDALRASASPQAATAGEACRGRAYGIEIAQQVFSGVEPKTNLMPGVG